MATVIRQIISAVALVLLGLAPPLAQATTLQTCTQKYPQPSALRGCIESERNRAANQLREANRATLAVVNQQVNSDVRKSALRSFRMTQAQHVRARAAQCPGKAMALDRLGCEADSDFAQIAHLKQLVH